MPRPVPDSEGGFRTAVSWAFGFVLVAAPVTGEAMGGSEYFWPTMVIVAFVGAAASSLSDRVLMPPLLFIMGYTLSMLIGIGSQARNSVFPPKVWTVGALVVIGLSIYAFMQKGNNYALSALYLIASICVIVALPLYGLGVIFIPLALAYRTGKRNWQESSAVAMVGKSWTG